MIESDESGGDRPGEQEPRRAARIEQSPRRGRKLDTWDWVALFLGVVLFRGDGTLGVQTWWEAALLLVGLLLMLSGLRAVLRGRRHLQPVLGGLRSVPDGERIVLFLRAFSDDAQFARTPASYPLRWLVWPPPVTPADLRTEEQQVARGLAPFGRLVAMGEPSDELPRAGAERSYASDEQWQNEVFAGFDRADLVVLSAGAGGGLEWEVEQAVHRDPERLVVAVTRDPRHYADFRAAVGHLFPKGLPDGPQHRASRAAQVRAVVWFERDWTPHLELLTGKFPLFRSVARTQYALPRALEPVYERAGVHAPREGSSPRPRPRTVPVAVTLFSVSWFGVPALLVSDLTYQSTFADHSENMGIANIPWLPPLFFGAVVWMLRLPFVDWMRRVLHGGPVAIFMMLMSCVPLGGFLLVWAVFLGGFSMGSGGDTAVGRAMSGFGVTLIPGALMVPLTIALLIGHRQVREWVDSRT